MMLYVVSANQLEFRAGLVIFIALVIPLITWSYLRMNIKGRGINGLGNL